MGVEVRSVSPRNSLLLIMDPNSDEIPDSMGGQAVAATSSCVAVGTKEEHDGPTEIRMADADEDLEIPALKVHDGDLELNSRELVAADILGEPFLRWLVKDTSVRVQIYTNHSTEPDEIVVLIG